MALNRAWYNSLVDDNGSNTIGTVWDKAAVDHVYDDVDAELARLDTGGRWTEVTTSAVGTQHNFNPGIVGNTVIRCTNPTLLTITGFPAGFPGQVIRVLGIAAPINLAYYDAGSSGPNRLVNYATSAPTPLNPGVAPTRAFAEYQYSVSDAQWILRNHEQGAWITPAFSAANFSGASGMTWVVAAGSVQTMKYRLNGRTVQFAFTLVNTSVGGTLSNALLLNALCFGSFVPTSQMACAMAFVQDNTVIKQGFVRTASNLQLYKHDVSNWAASASATTAEGQLVFEVN